MQSTFFKYFNSPGYLPMENYPEKFLWKYFVVRKVFRCIPKMTNEICYKAYQDDYFHLYPSNNDFGFQNTKKDVGNATRRLGKC